jgi:alkylation response protein AidB-like acyl-CoA dehydrogenase
MSDAFDEFLARVREGTVQRETDRQLLYDEVQALRELRFGALRLPVESGGEGIGLEELFDRVIRLSAADASLGHLWRGHIAFVESLLFAGDMGTWADRIGAGDIVGNAQSERQETGTLSTRIERIGDEVLLTGTKYYTTGSIYADWIHLAALEGDERVAVTVSARHPGVHSIDDWDGFGQLLTGSGTTTFEAVPVDPADVVGPVDDAARWHYLGAIFQLALVAVIAGIAQRALEDTIEFVRPRRRTFGFAGETSPRDDPLVQHVIGEVSAAASTARRVVLSIARDLDDARRAGHDLQPLQLEVYRAQRVVPQLVLEAATALFEVGGASAVSRGLSLDRHWRNVRTIATHNPVAQRTRAVGQFELNGTLPEWSAPGAPAKANS